jgi:uncharacterized OsmC-like protein
VSQEAIKNALTAAIQKIKDNPASSKVIFRASTELGDGMHCTGKVRSFSNISVDEPVELGGTNLGPNPVELVLVALGTCQEIVYRAYAAVLGIELETVKCDLRGYLELRGLFGVQDDVPAGFQKITFETTLKSSAGPEALKNLVQLVERHCPVLNTLQAPVEVSGNVILNGQPLALEATA